MIQLISPPRPLLATDANGPAKSMKRPRSVSPDAQRQTKRPAHLFLRHVSYSPAAMKAQQAEREARDAFPSLYAVASSLASTSSAAGGPSPSGIPKRASRADLGSTYRPARAASPAFRSSSRSTSEPCFDALLSPPVSAAFSRTLQAGSRSSSTDSFVGRASRLGLEEEDVTGYEDAGADSDYMDVEEGSYVREGSSVSSIFPEHSPGWYRRNVTPPRAPPSIASSAPTPQRNERMQITVSPERLSRFAQQKPKPKFSMGPRKGCERCERKEPNHFSHLEYE